MTTPNPLNLSIPLSEALTRLAPHHETVFTVSGGEDDRRLTVTAKPLEPDPPKPPVRAESPKREHVFLEAASFAAYLLRYGTAKDAVVYADPAQETAWATLGERAEGGVEVVMLKPQLHPLWAPWQGLVQRGRMALEAFRDFLNQHRRAVRSPDGRVLALQLAQIRAAVEVTIHDGRGRNALNGILVRSNVQGTDTKEIVDLPEELVLRVPLYVGAEPQDVNLDLVLDAGPDGRVTVLVAAGGVAEARVFAFDHMLAEIREALKTIDATVTYGQPKHGAWRYLEGNEA